MNTTNMARRHLVERAAEMLDREKVSRAGGQPVSLLGEPLRPASPAGAPPAAPQFFSVADAVAATQREAEGHQADVLEAPPPQPPSSRAQQAGTVTREPAAPRAAPVVPLVALQGAGLIQPPEGQGRSRSMEEISMVQHQVLRVMDEAPPEEAPRSRVLLVASALPREGRTFIALNLAASIATGGARPVVLVDADGRATSLTRALGLEGRPGLCDLIAERDGRYAELPVPTGIDRLFILPYGTRRATEGEPPPAATSAAAILRLAAAMPGHVILLDPPPCLSTSDSSALASASGQVVLVVDAQRTARDEVEAALDGLDASPVLQLLLNRAQLSSGSSFGAHYEAADAQ